MASEEQPRCFILFLCFLIDASRSFGAVIFSSGLVGMPKSDTVLRMTENEQFQHYRLAMA
jgi:hypothetical protein